MLKYHIRQLLLVIPILWLYQTIFRWDSWQDYGETSPEWECWKWEIVLNSVMYYTLLINLWTINLILEIVFLYSVSWALIKDWEIWKPVSCISPSVSHFQYEVVKFCISILSLRKFGKDVFIYLVIISAITSTRWKVIMI